MNRIGVAAVVAMVALTVGLAGPPTAHATGTRMVVATFRLEVSGRVAPRTTFWIAYGPLAGRFGIVQLRRAADGSYVANQSLPATGKTTFTYLTGQGVVHTRLGAVPGNPVATIRSIGPVTVEQLRPRTVRWVPPVG